MGFVINLEQESHHFIDYFFSSNRCKLGPGRGINRLGELYFISLKSIITSLFLKRMSDS